MRHDLLSDALSAMTNAISVGKKEFVFKPTSKLVNKVIELFKREGYIDDFEVIDDNKGGSIRVKFNGRMNKCLAIKPRFSAKKNNVENYEKRYLPAESFGCLILSTPKGLMTHQELVEAGIGGKLIAYVY